MSFNMNAADDLRALSAKFLIPMLFLHIPIVIALGFVTGNSILIPAVAVGVFALIPFISYRLVGTAPITRYLIAISFMLIIATLVYELRGHPWQIDMHMYFFAGLAMLLGLADWRVYIAATGIVAVHHLGLNFIVPSWVFPEASLYRVIMHAVIVIVETAVLALATVKLVQALDNASEATNKAERASKELETATEKQRLMQIEAQNSQCDDMENIAQAFEKEVGAIVDAVQEASNKLKGVAHDMSEGASNVRNNATDASSATTNISNNVNSVAIASEELSSSVSEISRQVSHSTQISNDATDLGLKATNEVQSLSKSVNEISNVIDLINDIANQTNLLALNATVEAARAGEAGKGFAVVASEVKNLANQTAMATEQITQQIEAIIGATGDTVRGIEGISLTLVKVQKTSSAIAAAIEQQGAATQEIAGNASRTASDVNMVSQSVEEVKEGASLNVGRSQEVLGASEELNDQANDLRNKLESFVTKLKNNADQRRKISNDQTDIQLAGE